MKTLDDIKRSVEQRIKHIEAADKGNVSGTGMSDTSLANLSVMVNTLDEIKEMIDVERVNKGGFIVPKDHSELIDSMYGTTSGTPTTEQLSHILRENEATGEPDWITIDAARDDVRDYLMEQVWPEWNRSSAWLAHNMSHYELVLWAGMNRIGRYSWATSQYERIPDRLRTEDLNSMPAHFGGDEGWE